MKSLPVVILVCGVAVAQMQGSAMAQDSQNTEAAMQAAQYRAGAAFRQLQQVQHEAKLAEQDYLNAQDAHRAALHDDASKREVESTKRMLDAARAKVAAARKAYDKEVNTVDRLHNRSGVAK